MADSDNDESGVEEWEIEQCSLLEVEKTDCLFCKEKLSLEDIFKHLEEFHEFNMFYVTKGKHMNIYDYIKFVNYVRRKMLSPMEAKMAELHQYNSDEYLIPVVQDDALLQIDPEEDLEYLSGKKLNDINQSSEETVKPKIGSASYQNNATNAGAVSDKYLETRILQLEQQVRNAEERACTAEEFLGRAVKDINICKTELRKSLLQVHTDEEKPVDTISFKEDRNNSYFDSYANYSIHEEMLKDRVRTDAYHNFISLNSSIFENKVVLDIGCGTGILSMLAAKAGAKHVIAIDQSDVAYQAMDIIHENGLDNLITVIRGNAEDISIYSNLPKIDIIISEWMGYFLLFEGMLHTVLHCRDKVLQEGGSIYPDWCNMSLVAISDQQMFSNKLKYWDNVYGFKMSCMKSKVIQEPIIEVSSNENIISDVTEIKAFDIMGVKPNDLEFEESFVLNIIKDATCTAILGYFDIKFQKDCDKVVQFSTGPHAVPTHWKQTIFLLNKEIHLKVGDNLRGVIKCMKDKKDPRSLEILLTLEKQDDKSICMNQKYFLS